MNEGIENQTNELIENKTNEQKEDSPLKLKSYECDNNPKFSLAV